MSKQSHFQSALTEALTDRDAARHEIFDWLSKLSLEERAKVPPEKFARLTPAQFAVLLGRPVPKQPSGQAVARQENGLHQPASTGNAGLSRRQQKRAAKYRSPFHRAMLCACAAWLCTATPSIGAFVAYPAIVKLLPAPARSVTTSTWPQCLRLDTGTDGCIYFVESRLTWTEAAAQLAMPLRTLLVANRATDTAPLPQGAPLIIWRFRRPLSN